ncbi:hypothetical protein [uncultured Thiodictyon sp.]|uniref:hypothetical protein n=1 Tax=uncultured Thiodictyon sp. TaxID=1846217 RepID=UPI0025FDDA08|nr:hypothetical protein [uncultured Thiodictyon sp.]
MGLAFQLVAVFLYALVGLVSLVMAYKNLSSAGFLPFHEQAAGRHWEEVDAGLQSIVTALMRLTGLGFGVIGLQLIVLPLVGLMTHDSLAVFVAAIAGLFFCLGLFVVNYRLTTATGAETPWRGSLYAAIAILIATVLSF